MVTVTEQGHPVQRRITTVAAARAVFNRLDLEDMQGDAKRREMLKGMIDGNPPFDDDELRERGLGNLTNVNFLSMGANLDLRASSAHELFLEVPTLIEVEPTAVYSRDPEAYGWCEIIADEFTQMFRDWPLFLGNMDLIWRDSDAFGFGVALFDNEWSWQFKGVRRGQVLVDLSASVDPTAHEVVCVRDEFRPADLFERTDDPEIAKLAGWNVDNVRKTLVETFGYATDAAKGGYNMSDWENLTHARINSDANFQASQFGVVQVVHMFVREVSGERNISHYIFTKNAGQCDDFLYEAHDKYDSMAQVLWFFPYNFGYGSIGSVRGVASKMARHEDLSNRILCSAADTVKLGSTLLLRSANAIDYSRLKITQIGPYTILPPEVAPVQTTFTPQVGDALQMRAVSDAVMRNNTGTYRQHSEALESPTRMRTATEVMAETSHEARYEKNAIAMRYDTLDKLYREIARRLFASGKLAKNIEYRGKDEAALFFERCVERGVPAKFVNGYRKNFTITAYRSIGMGSLGVKFDLTNQILNVSQLLPDEIGKRNAIHDYVAVRLGYRRAEKYVPRTNRDQIPSNEMSIAMLEWNDVAEGSQVIVGSDQWHPTHILVFLQGIGGILQQLQEGQLQSFIEPAGTVNLALQHISQHLQFLASNPMRKEEVGQIQQQLQQLEQPIQQLMALAEREQQAMRQQREAQEAAQVEAEREAQVNGMREQILAERGANGDQAALAKVQRDYELGLAKARGDFQIKQMIADSNMALKAAQTRADIANKNLRTQADVAAKAARAVGGVTTPSDVLSGSDIRNARAALNWPR